MIAYHVDRLKQLSPGDAISLTTRHDLDLLSLYPAGLSRHGIRYMSEIFGASFQEMTNWNTELLFELFRRAHFPNLPSRYQSFFVCQSKDELEKWNFDGNVVMVRFENAHVFQADASYLIGPIGRLEDGSFLFDQTSLSEKAFAYWSGSFSQNPLPEMLVVPSPSFPIQVVQVL